MARPTLISLFSGAGGLDYGFEAAGFDTGVAVEMNAWCCSTLRKSRPHWNVIERSIFDVPTTEMLAMAGRRVGELDLVIGGPPCQPFSKSGYWATGDSRRLDDPRAATLAAYLRVIEEAQPKAFLLENVEGLAYADKAEGLAFLKHGLRQINRRLGTSYEISARKVDAAELGVPQHRTRFIIVGSRDGSTFSFPLPTHGEKESLFTDARAPFLRTWDAIGDLENQAAEDLVLRGKWAGWVSSIPEGQNYLWHTSKRVEQARAAGASTGTPKFGWRRHFWNFLLKLAKDLPSWTLQAQPGPSTGPFHWENRRLSARELCRLQTFPDDVELVGSIREAQRQAGNAVPSLLAEVIGRQIRTQLLSLPERHDPLRLLRSRSMSVPPPEKYAPPPVESLKPRPAHPGTGKGYGALRRSRQLRASSQLSLTADAE